MIVNIEGKVSSSKIKWRVHLWIYCDWYRCEVSLRRDIQAEPTVDVFGASMPILDPTGS